MISIDVPVSIEDWQRMQINGGNFWFRQREKLVMTIQKKQSPKVLKLL